MAIKAWSIGEVGMYMPLNPILKSPAKKSHSSQLCLLKIL